MKRKMILLLALLALFQPSWAAYEYGAASFDIKWFENLKQWWCILTPNDPPGKLNEFIGPQSYIKIDGEYAVCSIQLCGNTGYSKSIKIFYMKLLNEYLKDPSFLGLLESIGNSKSQMPIIIKMKNGQKLEGTASIDAFGGIAAEENGIRTYAGGICVEFQFSYMHCKGEPNPESLSHETFIAQIFANYNIDNFELGKVKKKLYPYFSTSKTLQAMLKKLAEYTDELDIYFPSK